MPENNWYGHTFVMARYCGMRSLAPPIFGSLPHGWRLDYTTTSPGRLKSAPLLVWNDRHAIAASAVGVARTVTIGAPFIYATRSLVDQVGGSVDKGRGTLFMPVHSVSKKLTAKDHKQLIAEVEASEEGPFTVALFYVDLARDDVRHPYEEAGWRVMSFGRRDQNLYLYRIITEMLHQGAVVSDGISTAIWYAAHLGRRIRILTAPTGESLDQSQDTPGSGQVRWPALYADGVEGAAAIAMAADEVGSSSLLSPGSLKDALGWSSWRRPLASSVRLAVDVRHGRGMRRGIGD